MFQLSKDEAENLKSQNVTASLGGTRVLPKVFTTKLQRVVEELHLTEKQDTEIDKIVVELEEEKL